MVLTTSSVLSCLLPARLGFGSNHRPNSPTRTRNLEKHGKGPARPVPRDRLGEPELDPFNGNPLPRATDSNFRTDPPDLSRARANTSPSRLMPPPLRIPIGDIGESPGPANRSPNRQKRSSCTTFFAFSSKRKSTHGAPIIHIPQLQPDLLVPPNSVSGRWVSDSGQTQVQLINPSSIPSPLQADDDEYYCSYYASLTPVIPAHTASPRADTANISPSKSLSSRQQDHVGNPDLDSQCSSPVDSRPSHTHIHHPYAYSTPPPNIYTKTVDATPPLRHATSQPFQHHPQGFRSDVDTGLAHGRLPPSQFGYETSKNQLDLLQRQLKTSMSTPNLASGAAPVRPRSVLKKKLPRSKGQERWLSAESWWDALLSPSPRFKVKQTLRPHAATSKNIDDSVSNPAQGEPSRNLGVTFPSVPAPRPRAASATSNVRPIHHTLTRSRSTADLLLGQPSTSAIPRAGFEPALETLADESTTADQVPGSEAESPLPDPPISLAQVIDEGEAFEQQRAQWKQQASKSLGNKQIRSFSRARSKSLGARHAHGHPTSESSKAPFNLEFLAARTLLGSQSTMPTVHVSKPSSSSSHSKAYSHSHSQSAYSYSHTSHSHTHSHSHSHSLTTSNSSKSSRNFLPRGHSRKGSWSKPAFLKAGVLCGTSQDESYNASADEKVPSSSRIDVQGTAHMGDSTNAEGASDTVKVSPFQSTPGGEVGIAITSSPRSEGRFDLKAPGHPFVPGPRHQVDDQEGRWSSKYTQNSSEYAGPHPSAIDSSLPQLGVTNDVSLRHRLPPRAAIHPPVAPIAHPYRSVLTQPEQVGDNSSEGAMSKVSESPRTTEPAKERTFYPHISLSHDDFERYGIGEALVYASHPQPEEVPEAKQANVKSTSSLVVELSPPEEQSSSRATVVLQPEEPDTSSLAMNSPPSLSNSTIQMVMSGLDNPDDLDEFQDLFYKPHPVSSAQQQELSVTLSQVPTDLQSSASTSPLTHLVRKLSERVHGRQDPSQTPSDPTRLQDHHSNEGGTKFVFTDLAPSSSSLPPMESSSQVHVPIQKGSESTVQPFMVIPEDVSSSYTASVLESPLEECENDTFGYPIKHGQFEAATAVSPIQTPIRLSTHFSIQEDEDEEDESAFLSPVTKRYGMSSADVLRSSYLTTSDVSQMSALSDFPLPPSARPGGQPDHMSILQTRFEATPLLEPPSHDQREDEADTGQGGRRTDGEGDEEPSDDVDKTLQALRMTSRVASFESHRSTFGGSDDMDFITQLHQARP